MVYAAVVTMRFCIRRFIIATWASRVRIEPDETVYRLLKRPSDSIYFLRLRVVYVMRASSLWLQAPWSFFYTSATLPISALGSQAVNFHQRASPNNTKVTLTRRWGIFLKKSSQSHECMKNQVSLLILLLVFHFVHLLGLFLFVLLLFCSIKGTFSYKRFKKSITFFAVNR